MACFSLHPPDEKANQAQACAAEEAATPGEIAARLAHGQLVKELTVGLGMSEHYESTPAAHEVRPVEHP